MTVGDIIKPDDIPSAIRTKISDAVAGYDSSYIGKQDPNGKKTIDKYSDPNGKNTILNLAADFATTYKTNSSDADKGAYPGLLIKPYAVLNLIYKSMREACRCGTLTYQKYDNLRYVNVKNYRPKKTSYSVKVIFKTVNPETPTTADAFCEKVATIKKPYVSDNGTKTTISAQSEYLQGQLIRVLDLTDLLDKCVALCNDITISKSLGCINSCYNSCHSNCHGSSRSRR